MTDYLPESSEGLICLPYLAGERMPINDPNAKGVLFGLTLNHDRGHIYRAALEGASYGDALMAAISIGPPWRALPVLWCRT